MRKWVIRSKAVLLGPKEISVVLRTGQWMVTVELLPPFPLLETSGEEWLVLVTLLLSALPLPINCTPELVVVAEECEEVVVAVTLVDLFRFGSRGEPDEAALVVGKFPELEAAVVELSEVMVVMVGLMMFD